ncbi:MAG: cobaltochelatase CobT-related protein [Alphaproteobacteria bacterium]
MQNIANAISTLIKAFTLENEIEISSNDNILSLKKNSNIIRVHEKLNIKFQRGYIDSFLLNIKYSNPDIYYKYLPNEQVPQNIYIKCEEARYEALGALQYKGIATNLKNKWEYYCLLSGYNLFDQIEYIKIEDIISFKIRNYITNHLYPFELSNIFNKFKSLDEYLPLLKSAIYDQKEYANIICSIASNYNFISEDFSNVLIAKSNQKELQEPSAIPFEQPDPFNTPEELEVTNLSFDKEINNKEIFKTNDKNNLNQITSILDYKIYDSNFDEIIPANKLVSLIELNKLRLKLDSKILELNKGLSKSLNNFKRKLNSIASKYIQKNLETGVLDNTKFPMLIANHNFTNLYKFQSEKIDFNTIVTVLIDSSGSMRGKPITIAAICADLISKILEQVNVKTEILGFTTKDWQGGEVKKKWLANGQSNLPGRLNAIRHLIYKDSNQTYRVSKKNIAVMLKDGLLKENIDGEALFWAYNRIIKKPQKRKIIIVISDGAPIDEATLSNNKSDYLEIHLKGVIKFIEQKKNTELIAIGIGHDVTNYYKKSVTIKSVEELTDTIFNQLANIL